MSSIILLVLYILVSHKQTIREFRRSITTTEDNQSAASNTDFGERNGFFKAIFKKKKCKYIYMIKGPILVVVQDFCCYQKEY